MIVLVQINVNIHLQVNVNKAKLYRRRDRGNMAMAMSELEAKKFESFSEQNYEAVKAELDCECEPYVDVFTFNRWKAQGYSVIKGEKAIRIKTVVSKEIEDKKTGDKELKKFPKQACVFCRCQVEKREKKGVRN